MGVLIGSAVIPIAYCLIWSKCTAVGAITGAVSGFCLAIMSWLVTAKCLEGELTLHSTGAQPTPIPFCCTPINGLFLLFLPLCRCWRCVAASSFLLALPRPHVPACDWLLVGYLRRSPQLRAFLLVPYQMAKAGSTHLEAGKLLADTMCKGSSTQAGKCHPLRCHSTTKGPL